MGQERREVHVTGGKVNGRKEVRVNVPKGKSITGMMTGRKDAGKKGTTEKAGGRKVNDQLDATRRSYSEAVIEGASRTERVFTVGLVYLGDSILRKTDFKQRRRCCCLSSGLSDRECDRKGRERVGQEFLCVCSK